MYRSFNPARQSRQFARNPVWTQGVQNDKLTAARGSSTVIGEIDDLTLPDSIDGGVGLLDKTFQAFGKPVIPASLLAVAIHLELAKQLGNVSQACKMMGYSRDSFTASRSFTTKAASWRCKRSAARSQG